ncbi:MAG: hypothetical protein V3W41_14085 [Planctomycetota bacterium]
MSALKATSLLVPIFANPITDLEFQTSSEPVAVFPLGDKLKTKPVVSRLMVIAKQQRCFAVVGGGVTSLLYFPLRPLFSAAGPRVMAKPSLGRSLRLPVSAGPQRHARFGHGEKFELKERAISCLL